MLFSHSTMVFGSFTMRMIRRSFLRHYSSRRVPLFPFSKNMEIYMDKVAVIDNVGLCKYHDILCHSRQLAITMRNKLPEINKRSNRLTVSFLCSSDASYISMLLACWMNGSIAVPLCKDHPLPLLEYFIKDSRCSLFACSALFKEELQPLSESIRVPLMVVEHPLCAKVKPTTSCFDENEDLVINEKDDDAVIVYTSGTTGPSKGVLLTHSNLHAQICNVVEAWKLNFDDTMLHVLPLHHIHGMINCILCPLSVGGTVVILPKFDPLEVWDYITSNNKTKPRINLFSAVPTCFVKLVQSYDQYRQLKSLSSSEIKRKCMNTMRFTACASSTLPESIFKKWQELTGCVLVDRYGMTEIGTALSNTLDGGKQAGLVGVPLHAIKTRIINTELSDSQNEECEILAECNGNGPTIITSGREGIPGELQIKGPTVFKEYWGKPEETSKAFTKDGWFKTGDIAVIENNSYRILGRTSADIVKTGGFKISTLEIERQLLEHTAVCDCTVLGVPDETWGEILIAVLSIHKYQNVSELELKEFCKKNLPSYSVPKIFKFVDSLPRNVMGKINKIELRKKFIQEKQNFSKDKDLSLTQQC